MSTYETSNAVRGRWLTVLVLINFQVFKSQTLINDFFSPFPAFFDRTAGVALTTVYKLFAVTFLPNLRSFESAKVQEKVKNRFYRAALKVQERSGRSTGRSIICSGSWRSPASGLAVDQMQSFFEDVPITYSTISKSLHSGLEAYPFSRIIKIDIIKLITLIIIYIRKNQI